jgi:hypothetical protein
MFPGLFDGGVRECDDGEARHCAGGIDLNGDEDTV